MLRRAVVMTAVALALGHTVASAASSETGDHVVIRESNIREQPSRGAAKLDLLAPGSHVEVLEKPLQNGYACEG